MKLLILFVLICSPLMVEGRSSRRRRCTADKDLPYCIGDQNEGCQICIGTPYWYTRSFQHGKPIKLVGCCKRGVFYQNECVTDAFIDRNGELCKVPYGLDKNGDCFLKNPALLAVINITNFLAMAVLFVPLIVVGTCLFHRRR
jgi:hypothetical protein